MDKRREKEKEVKETNASCKKQKKSVVRLVSFFSFLLPALNPVFFFFFFLSSLLILGTFFLFVREFLSCIVKIKSKPVTEKWRGGGLGARARVWMRCFRRRRTRRSEAKQATAVRPRNRKKKNLENKKQNNFYVFINSLSLSPSHSP